MTVLMKVVARKQAPYSGHDIPGQVELPFASGKEPVLVKVPLIAPVEVIRT